MDCWDWAAARGAPGVLWRGPLLPAVRAGTKARGGAVLRGRFGPGAAAVAAATAAISAA